MATAGLPETTRIGRVALDVPDLERALAFYRDVIGLAVHEGDPAAERAVLGAPDEPLLVLRSTPASDPRPADAAGLYHTAFRVPTRAALGDALERIEANAGLDGASDHGVSEALYLRDPAGNGVEVYRDRPSADWPRRGDRIDMVTLPLALSSVRDAAGDGDSAPAGTRVGHVHLEVTSLAAARSVYVDALGMNVRATVGDSALFLAAGEYHHHLGLNVWRDRQAPASGRGLAWFELLVPHGETLPAIRDRLAAAGHEPEAVGAGFVVADPDAIQLHLRSE
jgi:catechol 2,3-dioxygenase